MLSGPYGAMILADLGAETIKVEPLHGEGTRKLLANDPNNSLDGFGAYYLTLNRNKKSVAIDLKSESGRRVFNDLVRQESARLPRNVLGLTEEPLASCDFNHDPRSAIVDLSFTRVSGDSLIKVLIWFDNEWGFANRMLDVAQKLG